MAGERHFCTLFAHRNGSWAKKHKGRFHYFGRLEDNPADVLDEWRRRWPRIVQGNEDQAPHAPAMTLKQLVNRWLLAQQQRVDAGERSPETHRKYRIFGQLLCDTLGKTTDPRRLGPAEFAQVRRRLNRYSITRRSDGIATIRGLFKWAVNAHELDRLPAFGPEFVQPDRKSMRAHRHKAGAKTIPPECIRLMIALADPHFKPVVLLGINTGMRAADIGELDGLSINFSTGVMTGLRHKTQTRITAVLWPETLRAIRAVMHSQPPILRDRRGLRWNDTSHRVNREWKALREAASFPAEWTHGWLRHTMRTVGGRVSRDAVRRIMGQRVGDELDDIYDHDDLLPQVQRVSDAVRWWLFTGCSQAPAPGDRAASDDAGGTRPPAG